MPEGKGEREREKSVCTSSADSEIVKSLEERIQGRRPGKSPFWLNTANPQKSADCGTDGCIGASTSR